MKKNLMLASFLFCLSSFAGSNQVNCGDLTGRSQSFQACVNFNFGILSEHYQIDSLKHCSGIDVISKQYENCLALNFSKLSSLTGIKAKKCENSWNYPRQFSKCLNKNFGRF